jgi:hypothetical protein
MALPGIDLPLDQNFELPTEDANSNWQQRAIPFIVRERVMLDLMAVLKSRVWPDCKLETESRFGSYVPICK